MRVGLIGLFGFGQTLARALNDVEGVTLAWGYHPDAARARAWDAARGTHDLQRMLADPTLQAVVIASPTPHHTEHVLACLAAGKAVFVEKPLAATAEECDRILTASEARPGLVTMTGHNLRRTAAAQTIKRLLLEGRVGRVVDMELNLSHGGAWNFRMGNWRGYRQWHREGPLSALGVHLFDLVHAWAGPVRSATALLRNLAQVTEAPDAGAALLELENGAAALVKTNYIVPSEERFVVTGTEGIVMWAQGQLWVRIGRDVERVPSRLQQLPCEPIDTIAEELREFCRAVEHGAPADIDTTFATGAAAVYVLEACYRSAVERRPVDLSVFPRYRATVGVGVGPTVAASSV